MEFVKGNDTIINQKYIRWVKKMEECMYVCCKTTGCKESDTIKICKKTNPESYNKLNYYFNEIN